MTRLVRHGAQGTSHANPNLGSGDGIGGDRLVEVLRGLEAWYDCPKATDGTRLGPLVAYRGKYVVNPDEPDPTKREERRFVGNTYVNCRPLSQHGGYRYGAVREMIRLLTARGDIQFDAVIGNPMSGLAPAQTLADLTLAQSLFLEPKTGELTLGGTIDVPAGVQPLAILGEELTNNFESSGKAVKALRKAGIYVVAIASYFNRSPHAVWTYEEKSEAGVVIYSQDIPVIAAAHFSLPEYRQDDPEVAEDIQIGNIVWEAKTPPENWEKLKQAMREHAA